MQLASRSPACLQRAVLPRQTLQRPALWHVPRATANYESDNEGSNVNSYCSIDEEGRKPLKQMTLGEKEQMFLEALSSYYYDGTASITDGEFDLLKDELVWSGSKVAVLSSDEQRFLEAQTAWNKGKQLMSDADFDALKARLKRSNSSITAQGARCSIRSRKMYSDASVDYLKLVGLNLPAALLVLGALFSVDDITGFEITRIIELPEPYGIVAVWGLVLPAVYVLASSLTNVLFKDALVLKANCPSCGHVNSTYFGDILTVSGNRDRNTIECASCKSKLLVDAVKREVMVQEDTPPPAKPTAAKVPAKAA